MNMRKKKKMRKQKATTIQIRIVKKNYPNIRDIEGITYLNCGDWVETCSAIVEHLDGKWEIIRYK